MPRCVTARQASACTKSSKIDGSTPEFRDTTHLFLATRFNCNKCHDHPFERWTQDQYYQTAAYFAQVTRKEDPASKDKKIAGTAVEAQMASR